MNSAPIYKRALLIIILVNIWGALPTFHYAPWWPLKPDNVRVYESGPNHSLTDIAVLRMNTSGPELFTSTGQTVSVYLRSTYRDWDAQKAPILTLFTVVSAMLLSFLSNRRATRSQPKV